MDDISMIREGSPRPPENFSHSEGVVNFKCRRGFRLLRPPLLLVVVNLFTKLFFLSPTSSFKLQAPPNPTKITTSACSLVLSRVPCKW